MSTAEKEKNPAAPKAPATAAATGGEDKIKERKTSVRQRGTQWSLERCRKYARRFKTEKEWMEYSPASHKSATYWGWLDACCEHMDKNARFVHAPVKARPAKLKVKATPIVSEMVAEAETTEKVTKPKKTATKAAPKEEKSKKKVS